MQLSSTFTVLFTLIALITAFVINSEGKNGVNDLSVGSFIADDGNVTTLTAGSAVIETLTGSIANFADVERDGKRLTVDAAEFPTVALLDPSIDLGQQINDQVLSNPGGVYIKLASSFDWFWETSVTLPPRYTLQVQGAVTAYMTEKPKVIITMDKRDVSTYTTHKKLVLSRFNDVTFTFMLFNETSDITNVNDLGGSFYDRGFINLDQGHNMLRLDHVRIHANHIFVNSVGTGNSVVIRSSHLYNNNQASKPSIEMFGFQRGHSHGGGLTTICLSHGYDPDSYSEATLGPVNTAYSPTCIINADTKMICGSSSVTVSDIGYQVCGWKNV